ncbi:MAG: prolyl oligopeptidase family serine peptidase [Rikenellaceae bacterium]
MKRININKLLVSAAAASLTISCMSTSKIEHKEYPATFRGDLVEDYFGTKVADPYRWLEDDSSEETAAWVKAQNEVTFDYLSQIPFRDAIKERLMQLWNYAKEGAPAKHGDYYYYSYNDGLQNQAVIYRKASLEAEAEIFIDPNTLSDDGTKALGDVTFSEDGRYCAYAVAASGSDWVDIFVLDTETMELLSDKIEWVKFSGAVWAPDSKSFYYSAYDAPTEGVYSTQNQFQKVYHHKLGEAQSADKLIYVDTAHPLRYFSANPSNDGKWLFIEGSEGTSGAEILYKTAAGSEKFKPLLPGFDHDYFIIDCFEDHLYVLTNNGALNYRLAKIDLKNPKSGLQEVIAEHPQFVLEGVETAADYFMASYLQDAQSKVYQYSKAGELVREVELPAIGSAGGFHGGKEAEEVYYSLSNYTTPSAIYSYSLTSGESTLYKSPEVDFDSEQFVTNQIFFTSKDGTRVPMFVSHRKDLVLDGNNPCYLYGYGGFQINLTPGFSPAAIMFMEQGGVHVVATLRGGLEYGEPWHQAGMLENKQNVFDDFIGAGEYLIANKYTSSEKLAIAGGSNGGLLVGACQVQRPDLFAVALPAVGVLDMLRYHKFTIGWGWAVEYGSSDNEEQFEYIYKYSPLHNIKDGVNYPATMVTTGDHDDRVVPAHSFKFAAQMQHSDGGENPILIRIESNAGHGAGKPTSKKIDELADTYAFLFYNTDTNYKVLK